MGPKMESKWSRDLEKDGPELILEPMEASAKKCSKKGHGELSDTARDGPRRPGPAREPGLGAPNKGKT